MTAAPGEPDPGHLAIAEALLPGVRLDAATVAVGQSHEVVLVPGIAAVRIARPLAAGQLPRRVELLRRLGDLGLPWAVPAPLGPVTEVGGRVAVALSWVPGEPRTAGTVEPRRLAGLLADLAAIDDASLGGLLGGPHVYAGGDRWGELLHADVVPLLPAGWRDVARRAVDAALALPPAPPSLVHGDLAGPNLHWTADGRVAGVLDWDFAHRFDPAVDAACLAGFGWDALRAAVTADAYRRARVWVRTFGLEQILFALLADEPAAVVERHVDRTIAWLADCLDD